MTTMLWEYVDQLSLMVLVHGAKPPSDGEWDAYVRRLRATHAAGRLRSVLVFSDGSGPNARQRQRLHHVGERSIKTAAVTHTVVARGIVTALSWFYEIRAFAPAQLDAAFEYLEIPRFDRINVRKVVAELRTQLADTSRDRFAGAPRH